MSRFNRKGAVTRGGRKRVQKDRSGKPVPSKGIALVTEGPHGFAQACQKAGVPPTRRQRSKFERKTGLAYQVGR